MISGPSIADPGNVHPKIVSHPRVEGGCDHGEDARDEDPAFRRHVLPRGRERDRPASTLDVGERRLPLLVVRQDLQLDREID